MTCIKRGNQRVIPSQHVNGHCDPACWGCQPCTRPNCPHCAPATAPDASRTPLLDLIRRRP